MAIWYNLVSMSALWKRPAFIDVNVRKRVNGTLFNNLIDIITN